MIVNKTVLFSSATLIINLNDLTVLPASGKPGFIKPARSFT
jgi:hypothetical protein